MVITIVENRNAATPASTESDNIVSSTLTETLPSNIVVSRLLGSFRSVRTFAARVLPAATSTSRRRRLRLKNARFRPENIADCDTQSAIPNQVNVSVSTSISPAVNKS